MDEYTERVFNYMQVGYFGEMLARKRQDYEDRLFNQNKKWWQFTKDGSYGPMI